MSEVFSHSRLASFEDCPKKYEYRYVRKIRRDTESIEGFVGKRVHEVLERLYLAAGRGHVPTLEQVLARYRVLFDEAYDPERVKIVRDDTSADEYRANGERSLRSFYRRFYPFDGDETLALEERVAFALDDRGDYRMQGYVDRIARARDGAIEIQDYKTGRFVPSQEQLDGDRQLALYQIGVAERFGEDAPVRLVWYYTFRDQVRTSTRTPEQLDALRDETRALIDRIRAARSFEPVKSRLCDWCEFQEICPLFTPDGADHGDRAAPAPKSDGQLSLL